MLAMRPGSSVIMELQSTLFLWVLFTCALHLSIADTQEHQKSLPESSSRILADLNRRLIENPSRLFRRDDLLTKEAGPLRQNPPAQLIDNGGPRHSGKLDDGGQNPRRNDLGPHRPSGQVPSSDGIRLTPLEILSGRKLGQRLSNPRGIDIGPQRPGGQSPLDESVSMGKLVYPGRQNDIGVTTRTGGNVYSQDQGRRHREGDIGPQRPNGQRSPTVDLGPQRPNGQHPPRDMFVSSNRFRREVDTLDSEGQERQNDEPLFVLSSESFVDDSSDNDIEVSPYAKILTSEDDSNWINSENLQDLGPHRPMGSVDPNGVPLPPVDLGPQRPSGQHPPSTSDLGPQRPSGQHPPTATHSKQVDLGPHRPNGEIDPNGVPPPPSDLGPHRPSGQHQPFVSSPPQLLVESFTNDFGPRRVSRATEPDGVPPPPSDLGPHRPLGQHPHSESESKSSLPLHAPTNDLGPHRPHGAKDPNVLPLIPIDLGPQRPSGQNPPSDSISHTVVLHFPPGDLGPHRPSGNTDPNGTPSPPVDLGPQSPSGQHPPLTEDLSPHRPSGQHRPEGEQRIILTDPLEEASQKVVVYRSPPSDLGPHRPSGATDPNGIPTPSVDLGPQRPSGQFPLPTEGLGPQRPSGQHPPEPVQRKVLTNPLGVGSEKIVVIRSPPSDLGPHRPSGATDPNGIPSPPVYLGPQRPSGQHPPSTEDLGPHRPSGQHPPEGVPRIILTDPLVDVSQKVVFQSPPSDLGPHRPSGNTDPNGIPSPPIDLGPQRPSGQHPPLIEDLGPRRPSGQNRPKRLEIITSGDPVQDASQKTALFYSPPSDLGPHRPSGLVDPNGLPTPPSDLGPQRPSGQYPPRPDDPLRIESTVSAPPVDLGPHRPAGSTDPNIKPGIENDQDQLSYNVYWNVPTFMCHKHGYRFRNLSGEYGIVQNPNDAFRGSKITILYDPGLFPAILQDEKGKKFLRNGGVPQEGDIQKHLVALEESIEEQVPKDFDGLGVIDFEAWRPVWAQNWGALNIYRTVSMDLEKRRDPAATRRALEIRAKVRFEAAARVFFESSVQLAQQLRPRGRWGFYGFPHCFNQVPARPTARPADFTCASQHQHQNDKIDWLWRASTALYPSVYLSKANKTAQDELAFVSGRLAESRRVSRGVPVYAYVWYRYHDTGEFLNEDDLWSSLSVPHKLNLAGTILWGSSSDLNNRDKCARFSQVLQTSIGPAVARATGRRIRKTSPSPTVIFATRR